MSDDIAGHFLPVAEPTNAGLERAIRGGDAGACGVYADWLQSQGSVMGEWIALAAALEGQSDQRKQARLAELTGMLRLPSEEFATWETKHGFFQWLRLENSNDWMTEAFDAEVFVRKLFATPLCASLAELRIGILRWDQNSQDVPRVLEVAGDFAWSKTLTALHLGDVSSNIDMLHHVIGDVGAIITKTFPALRSLTLHSGAQAWRNVGETFGVAGLALPELATLVVETCAMTRERLRELLAAKLPALTRLELWFGGMDRDATATVDDLAPLFDEDPFPGVTRLGLCNQEFGGELLELLAEAKLAERIVTLDLSRSTLDATTAPQLAAMAKLFPALRVLDVSDNFLSADDLATITSAFANVEVITGEQDKLSFAEDNNRFASVCE